MKDKVSIIIPVHNSSKYLNKCIDSLINQTYENIEIIAIENGSTDNSLELLNSYNNIRVLSIGKANISIARNKGIELAKGEYLCFVDSDDYVEKDYIKELINNINESDMCICDIKSNNKGYFKTEYPYKTINKDEIINNLEKFNYGPCNKIFKKSIIDKYNITFPTDIKYEDIPFVLNYITKSSSISKVNKPLYNYIIHSNSEQTTVDNKIFDIIKSIEKCEKIIDNKYLINLKVKTLTTFITKSRYISDKDLRNSFIDAGYNKLNEDKDWKDCKYLKETNFFKRIIYKNRLLMKIYTTLYFIKRR